tara:strand:+ start:165 stop:482 length:318 start_codon:yes stop_codon:yes gene_type:complete
VNDKNCLISSIYKENIIPKITPTIVAIKPIRKPVKKKDLTMDFLDKPKDFKIAISFVLFLIRIVSPEIILKAATIIIKVSIINITFLSTFNAEKKDLFRSDQELT